MSHYQHGLVCNVLPSASSNIVLLMFTAEDDTMQLKPHQETGIAYMETALHDENYKGGIIADEMGLGKTSMYTHPPQSFTHFSFVFMASD